MERDKRLSLQEATVNRVDTYIRPMLDQEQAAGRRTRFTLFTDKGPWVVDGSDGFDGTTITVTNPDGTTSEGTHYRISLDNGTLKTNISYISVDGVHTPRRVSVEGFADEGEAAERANGLVNDATGQLIRRQASLPTG